MTVDLKPILYVEDEDNDAMIMRLAFRKAEVANPLRIVTDGKQALDYLWGQDCFSDRAQNPLPCLLLLDLNLPQCHGFTVLERIRAEARFKDLPVVIFTSSDQAGDQARARDLGASDYIVKPSQMARVVAFARSLNERWLRAGSA
jgi:DNA-binding response OmpR family regulator